MDGWSQVIGGSFVVGAIFWAGATYSRIGRIEKDLGGLVGKLEELAELAIIKKQIDNHNEEIVMLRKAIFGDQWKRFGGPGGQREE